MAPEDMFGRRRLPPVSSWEAAFRIPASGTSSRMSLVCSQEEMLEELLATCQLRLGLEGSVIFNSTKLSQF